MTKKIQEVEEIPLSNAITSSEPLDDKNVLTDVYLKIYASERSMENAYYKAQICDEDGSPIQPINVRHKYTSKKPDKIKDVNEIALTSSGLVDFMKIIQSLELGSFSSLTMYAQERSVSYSGNSNPINYYRYDYQGPPAGVTPIEGRHYFLDLILGAPGKKIKLSKTSKVKACKSCDTMLLRYTYDWRVQCDDLEEKVCPYCKKPLEIIERDRQYVVVEINKEAKDCVITGTNNQIGILYEGRPLKATVKVAALRNFLMNYQNLFSNGTIGPLDITLDIVKSRKGFNFLKSVKASKYIGEIEWRPAVLFPEDLISF